MKLSRVAFYTAMLISSGATYAQEPVIIGNPSVATEMLTVTDSSEAKAEINPIGELDVAYLKASYNNKIADIQVSGPQNLAIRFVDQDKDANYCSVLKGQQNEGNTIHVCFLTGGTNITIDGKVYRQVTRSPDNTGKTTVAVRSGGKNVDGRTNPQADLYQMSVELVSYTI